MTDGDVHKPYPDDGVTYCGWRADPTVIDGCGYPWPCPTVQARTTAPEGQDAPDPRNGSRAAEPLSNPGCCDHWDGHCSHCDQSRTIEPLDLDAIRERQAKAAPWCTGTYADWQPSAASAADVPALVAEVERLRRECDEDADFASALAAKVVALTECAGALHQLVALKDGPRDSVYDATKPVIWQKARDAVAAVDTLPPTPPAAACTCTDVTAIGHPSKSELLPTGTPCPTHNTGGRQRTALTEDDGVEP